ncbi:MAG: hypothetical protein JWO31_1767 [Phycisphaerales bacterium]|nr:hypothetical protein [Phycisphaerales bacterium]
MRPRAKAPPTARYPTGGAAGHRPAPRRRPRGVTLIYATVILLVLTGACSLAVDLGRVQLVKTELQRCADATARGYLAYQLASGTSYANSMGPALYATANNPVDGGSGVAPTVTVVWGTWTAATKTFTPVVGTPLAVKVTASRKAADGNAVPLIWGRLIGRFAQDVTTSAVAVSTVGGTANVNVDGTANPYLAGMPSGTTNLAGDSTDNAAPYQVTSVPVVPGSYISLTNVAGQTNVLPGYVPDSTAGGLQAYTVHHGQNYNKSIDLAGPENGIADAVMPESTLMGLFLTDARPDASATPATVDWSAPSSRNQAVYSNLGLKQPFPIGDGATSNGTVQKFLVPPGATRLYIAIWDGIGYYNNTGAVTGTITATPTVKLVQ